MATVPYHTHSFDIPTASTAEIITGEEPAKVVTPSELRPAITQIVSEATDTSLVDRLGYSPANARPGVEMVHKCTMLLKRSEGAEGLGAEIFPGALKAPQGSFVYVDVSDGLKRLVIKQRVNSAVPPPDVGSNQYHRFICYKYNDVGQISVEPEWFTAETLALSHQALSGCYFKGGILGAPPEQLWIVSATADDGPSASRGVSFIKSRDAVTTQADVTNYQLFKNSEPYNGAAVVSTSGKLIAMIVNHTGALGNDQSTDERNLIFVWKTADILAGAVGGDATGVRPISQFSAHRPPEQDACAFQDYHLDDTNSSGFIELFAGSTGPLMRHYVVTHDVLSGAHIRTRVVDDARSDYTKGQLESGGALLDGGGEIGLPRSFEAEGYTGFPGEAARICVTQEIWSLPGDIVSLPETPDYTWACLTDNTRSKPGDDRNWTRSTLAATRGVWDAFTTDYAEYGATTRRRCVVTEIREATGDPAEKPLDADLTTKAFNSSLHFPTNNRDVSVNAGQALTFSSWHANGGYFTNRAALAINGITLRDDSVFAIDNDTVDMGVFAFHRDAGAGVRSFIQLWHQAGVDARFYTPFDVLYADQARYGRATNGWVDVRTRAGSARWGVYFTTTAAIMAAMNGLSLFLGSSAAEGVPSGDWAVLGQNDVAGDFTLGDLIPGADNINNIGTPARRALGIHGYVVDAKTEFRVNTTKVVGARSTGWASDAGTAKKTANASYTQADASAFLAVAAQTADIAYTQATLQTLMNTVAAQSTQIAALTVLCNAQNAQLKDISQTVKAVKDAQIAHGLTGT